MKRLTALLLALLTMLCPALAEESDWYLETAMELAEDMGKLANDEAYFEMMSSMTFECVEPLKTADYTRLRSVHRLNMPDEAGVRVLLKLITGGDLSDAALKQVIIGLPAMPLTVYIGTLGSEQVAAMAVLTCERTFIAPEDFIPAAYVLEFDGAFVGAAFKKTGEDTLTLEVMPLFAEKDASIEDLLGAIVPGYFPVEVEKIR